MAFSMVGVKRRGMHSYTEHDLLAANVNPVTGLATDYLNLFNEAIMLFEMGLDMPDMAEELTEWAPHSVHVEHFERSGFEMKDVVIAAYDEASPATFAPPSTPRCEQALAVFASSIDILLSSNILDDMARADLGGRLREMKAMVSEMDLAYPRPRRGPRSQPAKRRRRAVLNPALNSAKSRKSGDTPGVALVFPNQGRILSLEA